MHINTFEFCYISATIVFDMSLYQQPHFERELFLLTSVQQHYLFRKFDMCFSNL